MPAFDWQAGSQDKSLQEKEYENNNYNKNSLYL